MWAAISNAAVLAIALLVIGVASLREKRRAWRRPGPREILLSPSLFEKFGVQIGSEAQLRLREPVPTRLIMELAFWFVAQALIFALYLVRLACLSDFGIE